MSAASTLGDHWMRQDSWKSMFVLPALISLALFDIVSKIIFLPRTSFTYLVDRIAVLTIISAVMLYFVRRVSGKK